MAAMAVSTLALSAENKKWWWWSWPYNAFLFWEGDGVLIMPIDTPASSKTRMGGGGHGRTSPPFSG